MAIVNKRTTQALVEDLDLAIEKATRNDTCLYPGCSNPPIGSHIIAHKTLKLIAEKSHVLTWLLTSTWDMIHTIDAGKSLEQLNEEPVSVGIGDKRKITEPLFCNDHDGKIFTSLERQDFSFQPEQVMLLAYRASCSLTFPNASLAEAVLEVARKHGSAHSLDTPERLQKLKRFHAVDSVVDARQLYTQMYQSRNYTQLGWAMYVVNVPPCVAATYSLIPVNENDAQAIVNGTQTVTAEDVVSFSFLPYQYLNNSICVISWLKGSSRAQRFMILNRINELSKKEQQNLFFTFTFESPTIYISPVWWKALSKAKREEYKQIHLEAGREHAALV